MNDTDRRLPFWALWIVPAALLILAVVLALTGPVWLGAIAAVLSFAAALGIEIRARFTGSAIPQLTPDDLATIRAERDTTGEIAAVRALRRRHAGLSLRDAVHLVRSA
ncbi:hypothetical protein [Pseudonocardia sp. TRM90224]|uniref:hypothetical protein n=1 Tax=Pseudonocardia sp. TRM90224 TaxID=2812678 RepID=UPI001E5A9EF8|nr:hypothetical protein [Pseudonocardia sp. TRM90224]